MVDDSLANELTSVALSEMVREAVVDVAAATFVVEKQFQPGHELRQKLDIPVIALARIARFINSCPERIGWSPPA
jgi:xanthine phosphoribosyltransferase